MLNDLIVLLDYYPGALFIVLMIGGVIGIGVERLVEAQKRSERKVYWQGRRRKGSKVIAIENGKRSGWTPQAPEKPSFDAAEQLRIVMGAQYSARTLLNRSERRVLSSIDRILSEVAPEWRAMCQVSLGEILSSDDPDAFRAVNSKRVDFLIVDAESRPQGVVEYQGKGHHQGTAAARDAVKKEALRRASIDYYEISAGDTPSQLRAIIQRLTMRRGMQPNVTGRIAGR